MVSQDPATLAHLQRNLGRTEQEYLVEVAEGGPERGPWLMARLQQESGGAKVSWQNEEQLRFVLREGRKRQIRRMCELVGLHVVGLKRVRMGHVMLGALPPGQWRYLGPDESF